MDGEGLTTESTFYDDHYVLDTTKKRWKRRDAIIDPDLPPPPPRAWDRKALQASLVAPSLTPPPRIGACCAVAGKILYVLGGTLEVGDKELALDDVWCRYSRKKNAPWTRLVAGTMSKRSAHWHAEDSDKEEDDDEDLGATSSDSDSDATAEEEKKEEKRDQWTR